MFVEWNELTKDMERNQKELKIADIKTVNILFVLGAMFSRNVEKAIWD